MKILALLILSVLPLACASAPRGAGCEEAIEHVSIEYKGVQRLNAWGRDRAFGTFAVSNKALKEMRIPLDGAYYPLIVHGRYVELQSRLASSEAWELDAVVLEEFLQPRKWLVIGSGDGMTFFLDMAGPENDVERSRAREYRVSLKDESGCRYFSPPFRVGAR